MKHLGISGGATKISGLCVAAYELLEKQNYKPDIISGVSAGSILTLPIIFKKWDMLEKIVKNLKLIDFFDVPPVTNSGSFSLKGLIRIILGKHSLGSEKNLVLRLKEFISPSEFELYKSNNDMPIVYVGAIDFADASRKFFNIKEVDYDTYLQYVLASSSIPIFTESVVVNDMQLFDGGVRNHIATPWILENLKIEETVSIYARSKDYKIDLQWKPKNILQVLERYVDITNVEISKKDEKLEDLLCEKLNVKQTKIFLPSILKSLYDTDNNRLTMLYDAGREAAYQAF